MPIIHDNEVQAHARGAREMRETCADMVCRRADEIERQAAGTKTHFASALLLRESDALRLLALQIRVVPMRDFRAGGDGGAE